jgi:putative ABC transport system substrate-binding protein
VRRREFITLIGGAMAAWPLAAFAQEPARRPRITLLGGSQPRPTAKVADAFIEGMRALGYTEGRDFEMEYRWAEGYLERLPALAEESVRRGADVIVVGNVPSCVASRDATKTIPIVCALFATCCLAPPKSSRARSPPTCRSYRRPNGSSSSTCRRPGRLALPALSNWSPTR